MLAISTAALAANTEWLNIPWGCEVGHVRDVDGMKIRFDWLMKQSFDWLMKRSFDWLFEQMKAFTVGC